MKVFNRKRIFNMIDDELGLITQNNHDRYILIKFPFNRKNVVRFFDIIRYMSKHHRKTNMYLEEFVPRPINAEEHFGYDLSVQHYKIKSINQLRDYISERLFENNDVYVLITKSSDGREYIARVLAYTAETASYSILMDKIERNNLTINELKDFDNFASIISKYYIAVAASGT